MRKSLYSCPPHGFKPDTKILSEPGKENLSIKRPVHDTIGDDSLKIQNESVIDVKDSLGVKDDQMGKVDDIFVDENLVDENIVDFKESENGQDKDVTMVNEVLNNVDAYTTSKLFKISSPSLENLMNDNHGWEVNTLDDPLTLGSLDYFDYSVGEKPRQMLCAEEVNMKALKMNERGVSFNIDLEGNPDLEEQVERVYRWHK
ncbi:hypothetical protein QVD17_20487 [Tagetes erecta]|uniref:Uncharacterized protein n=1 Tax=Tagetes erecta TaxID=13708 RepID=A0AAD8KRR2_TARER|nr:hypothetical protein QVD17_20487 [Tagetes erecta]